MNDAEKEAKNLKDEYISVEHLLLAGTNTSSAKLKELLKAHKIDKKEILKALQDIRGSQRVTDDNPESKFQALEKYGQDLVALANSGKLDPVIGRDDETAQDNKSGDLPGAIHVH